ncbi:hypothetical protein JF546_18460 [Nitratireductor aquimarinus]|uniref:hypothetical protein n=1 Tax=Alphaproteobacteria TaxID=28211 RepID=UPI0019D348D1|nr:MULTISPECIES: hypothetical protein [Alphaproteobacteria]MBY6022067.1 hypothetical protein [Nitratireductor sp. DP7N14-4]MBN7757279.1 hypothetical protein [Nitratireductor aquimarinus]MBN7761220.1 hypothetical protein [Nitratireductor aquibiodomus]MBN7777185.1 hypothetical protein [Nitratireductor pacificus]MBN7780856.1 hypothetical protein [Nitratireductor pacificus]
MIRIAPFLGVFAVAFIWMSAGSGVAQTKARKHHDEEAHPLIKEMAPQKIADVTKEMDGKSLSPGGVDLIVQSRSLTEGLEFERKEPLDDTFMCQWLLGTFNKRCRRSSVMPFF